MTALDDLCATPFHEADAPVRSRILSRLADTELAVALLGEPDGDEAEIRLFDLPAGRVALACDGEDRLAGFFGAPTGFAAMPGRVLAGMLAGDGIGLLVNPGQPSEMLLDAATLGWLETALSAAPQEAELRLRLTAPDPEAVAKLAGPLAERLGDLRGLIQAASLLGAQGEGAGHVLLIGGADPDHQSAVAKALSEALSFLPEVAGGVDISFAEITPPMNALRFDLTPPEKPVPAPKGPPILR